MTARRRDTTPKRQIVAAARCGGWLRSCSLPFVPAGAMSFCPSSRHSCCSFAALAVCCDHRVEIGEPRRSRRHLACVSRCGCCSHRRLASRRTAIQLDGARLGAPARRELRAGQPARARRRHSSPSPVGARVATSLWASRSSRSPHRAGSPRFQHAWRGRIQCGGTISQIATSFSRSGTLSEMEGSDGEGARCCSRLTTESEPSSSAILPRSHDPADPGAARARITGGAGAGWALYHRLSTVEIGPPLGPTDEFRFNDQLVWGAGRRC